MASNPAPRSQVSKPVIETIVGSSIMGILFSTFIEEALKAVIPETSRWVLIVLVAVALFVAMVLPAVRQATLARRRRARTEVTSAEIQRIIASREVDSAPWTIAALVALALLAVELVVSGLLAFVLGASLGQILSQQEMIEAILPVVSVVTAVVLLFVSFRLGIYATHRIARLEQTYISVGVLAYRFVALPLNLMLTPNAIEPIPWLAYTGALLIAAWMGHRFGVRTEGTFALSYVSRQLTPEDQAHLLDLAASVAVDPQHQHGAKPGQL